MFACYFIRLPFHNIMLWQAEITISSALHLCSVPLMERWTHQDKYYYQKHVECFVEKCRFSGIEKMSKMWNTEIRERWWWVTSTTIAVLYLSTQLATALSLSRDYVARENFTYASVTEDREDMLVLYVLNVWLMWVTEGWQVIQSTAL